MSVLWWTFSVVILVLTVIGGVTPWLDRSNRHGVHSHSWRVFSYARDWNTGWNQGTDWQSDWQAGDTLPEYNYLMPRMKVLTEQGVHSPSRRVFSYPRDWDTDWSQSTDWQSDWQLGDPVPEYNYLMPRMEVLTEPQVTRGLLRSQQQGSVLVPYQGATVRVKPQAGNQHKFYRGVTTSTMSDESFRKRRGPNLTHRNGVSEATPQYWQYSQDEPAHRKVCARCPSDRAVLARKGSNFVIMETPPIIPCHPRSSVKKVKQEVVFGPQAGDRLSEGSYKIAIRLYRNRRTLATCITRYNVIVRKCEELLVGPGVKVNCPLGKAWGANCNISCEPGYQLEGDSVTECNDDLEWSGTTPHCVSTTACPVPITPDHGQLSCRTPRHQPVQPRGMLPDGSQCHYLCHPGYTIPPTQHHLSMVRCVAGSWDRNQDPTCVETNDLRESELLQQDISADDALRFDGAGCPDGFCRNGGRCIMIMEEPMCSCKTGYYGTNCEVGGDNWDGAEYNTIT